MATLGYRLRIRNAADSADDLVLTSLAAGANPYVIEPPTGDGLTVDPLSGETVAAEYTVRVIDAETGGAGSGVRVVTSVIEDAGGRRQLLSRRCYVETTDDNGGSWDVLQAGFLTGLRLVNALAWEFAVGDTRRIEKEGKLFERLGVNFRTGTCLIGGPVRGGFGPLRDYGGWRMKVTDVTADTVELQFVSGPVLLGEVEKAIGEWLLGRVFTEPFIQASDLSTIARGRINKAANAFLRPGPVDSVNETAGVFPDLEALVFNLDGTPAIQCTPFGVFTDSVFGLVELATSGPSLVNSRKRIRLGWSLGQPAVNDEFYVYVYSLVVTEQLPLHLEGHPVDLAASALDEFSIAYDATSVTTVKNLLGPELTVLLRPTKAQGLGEFLKFLFGLFGFSARPNAVGALEFFPTRLARDLTPVAPDLTDAMLREGQGTIWESEEKSVVNRVVIEQQTFQPFIGDGGDDKPLDAIRVVPDRVKVASGDQTTFGTKELTYSIPGQIRTTKSQPSWSDLGASGATSPTNLYLVGIAAEIFFLYGRGAEGGELRVLRGVGADQLVGDVVVLDIDHRPNGNVRGGRRRVQITGRTETPSGPTLKLLGVMAESAPGTVPTFTLTKSTDQPFNVAELALTNTAAIQAEQADAVVRVEWGFGAIEPAAGTLLTYFLAAPFFAESARTPPVNAGTTVWVRMRVEHPNEPPGAWSDWDSVALDALPDPSALAATPVDAATVDLEWVNADTDHPVEILLRKQGETIWTSVGLAPPGSTQFQIGQIPVIGDYTAGVRLREYPPLAGVSNTVTDDFTLSGAGTQLLAPIDPRAFTGPLTNNTAVPAADGKAGLSVIGTEFPSYTVFEAAVETAPGSGTFGGYDTFATIDTNASDRTLAAIVAPNDGRKRRFRAKHTRPGWLDSPYTDPQDALPWLFVKPFAEEPPDMPLVFQAPEQGVDTTFASTGGVETDVAGDSQWKRYDSTPYRYVRLDVNVVEAGPAGSVLRLQVWNGVNWVSPSDDGDVEVAVDVTGPRSSPPMALSASVGIGDHFWRTVVVVP